jgi:hypothetical protein
MPRYATKEKNSQGHNKKNIDHNYLKYTHFFFWIKTLLKNLSHQTRKNPKIKKTLNKFGVNAMKGKKLGLLKPT